MTPDLMLPSVISLYAPTMASGKSSAANYLVDRYGYTRVKFAGPLKAMAVTLLEQMGFDDPETIERMIEGDLKELPIPSFEKSTPRSLMQTLGTEWGREAVDLGFWVDLAMAKAIDILKAGGRVVIDDTRFKNEINHLRAGFPNLLSICVVRPDAPVSKTDGLYEGLLSDEDFDVKITNDDTLEILCQAIDITLLTYR